MLSHAALHEILDLCMPHLVGKVDKEKGDKEPSSH